MAKRLLIFQHQPWEGPGLHLRECATKRGVAFDVVEVWRESIPPLTRYDGLVVLGGTPNVDQVEQYPFLAGEKAAIRQSLNEDRPYIGFCLGHQLLADALGAGVGNNFCSSVGFIQGRITRDGQNHPLFENLPRTLPLFKWHTQAILPPVPKHIEILVTSPDCLAEAISVSDRPHIIGLQFDNHAATLSDISQWVAKDGDWLSSTSVDSSLLLEQAMRHETHVGDQFDIIFNRFIDLL